MIDGQITTYATGIRNVKALGCRYIVTAIFTAIMWGILFALYHFFGKSLVINVIIISAAGLFLLNLIIGPIFRHRFYKYNK